MGISIFPSTAAEFVSNNFVVDMNDTTNNTADAGGVKQAGPYSMSFSSGDTSFDVYLIDADGNSVGYSNTTSITASGLFSTVVILGVAQDEIISFTYQGSVNNADGEGDEPGAGAYLESISPTDLPSIDDTATVTGGNFGANTEIFFDSGAISLAAKNITVNNSTELLVTRPDALVEDDSPYTVRAVTTGVPQPTGTNANILTDAVTAGSDPTWVTTSPLNSGNETVAFSQTLEATDSDGTIADYSVTAGTLPTGLSLNSSTGVLSGTPTAQGNYTFTVTATDDGGNTTDREFEQFISTPKATGGVLTTDGTDYFHTFTSTDDIEIISEIVGAELFVLAGGGAGGSNGFGSSGAGGGGAGGLLETTTTISAGTYTCTIGAGGQSHSSNGSDSSFGNIATAIGGGGGAEADSRTTNNGNNGGSGGGANNGSGGLGTAGQGNNGGNSDNEAIGGGGGGAGAAGGDALSAPGDGGNGLQRTTIATQSGINVDGGYFAGGGSGGKGFTNNPSTGGLGGGGTGGSSTLNDFATAGVPNTGGGGGGDGEDTQPGDPIGTGGSGLIVLRYPV